MSIKRTFMLCAVTILLIFIVGCAWQRIAQEPVCRSTGAPLPIRLGIQSADNPVSNTYVPSVVAKLKAWQVFDSVTFPYREGDVVDAVLLVNISGVWQSNQGSNYGKGFLIGLTLGAASAAVGSGMKGQHDVTASLQRNETELAKYSFHQETPVKWGLGADSNEVAKKADQLLIAEFANQLAECIKKDWPRISSQLTKSS